MDIYQHFILTAFNIDFNLKPRAEILAEDYLEKRFAFFEDICFPSVVSQTNQNFQWLVFFDREIGARFKDKINEFCQYKNFIPIYTLPTRSDYAVFADAVRERLLDTTKYVITSNLDNDDALSRNFISLVQDNFCERDFEFINFPFGLTISERFISLREYFSSPFLSLVERNDRIVTCRVIVHAFLDRFAEKGLPVRQIICQPTWLQLVQDTNALNRFDINAAIVSQKNVDRYFEIGTRAKERYLTRKHTLKDIFRPLFNKKLTWKKRIRNCFNAIDPWFSITYLSMSQKIKNTSSVKLSFAEAKELCCNCDWEDLLNNISRQKSRSKKI